MIEFDLLDFVIGCIMYLFLVSMVIVVVIGFLMMILESVGVL